MDVEFPEVLLIFLGNKNIYRIVYTVLKEENFTMKNTL